MCSLDGHVESATHTRHARRALKDSQCTSTACACLAEIRVAQMAAVAIEVSNVLDSFKRSSIFFSEAVCIPASSGERSREWRNTREGFSGVPCCDRTLSHLVQVAKPPPRSGIGRYPCFAGKKEEEKKALSHGEFSR